MWMETLIRRRGGSGYGAAPVYNGWYVDLFYGGAAKMTGRAAK